tara:strand:- start:139 stop:420 length:282 start_codon:yes stop_codon:yes gene_type:complete
MIDTDKYEELIRSIVISEEEYIKGSDSLLEDSDLLKVTALQLLAEVKRLREENQTLRKMDWEYECLWDWLAENTNLLNTIEPLMEEWKKEMIE